MVSVSPNQTSLIGQHSIQNYVHIASVYYFQVQGVDCQKITNMTVSEERFEFLSRTDWKQDGENDIIHRRDENHLLLGLCYYIPTGMLVR